MNESSDSLDYIDWPDSLPLPLVDRSLDLNPRIETTTFESNRTRARRLDPEAVQIISAQWNFTEDQHNAFRVFFIEKLGQGVEKFRVQIQEESLESGALYALRTYVFAFVDGTYSLSHDDNLFSVQANLLVDEENLVDVFPPRVIPPPPPPTPTEIPVEMIVTYPDEVCKDEVRVDIPESVVGIANVVIEHSNAADGPWNFWGETRADLHSVTVGNYFKGKYVRIRALNLSGVSYYAILVFDPPAVDPPTIVCESFWLGDMVRSPTPISPWPVYYGTRSVLDDAKTIAAVYPGNLTDPETDLLAYTIPTFSNAFVEVGPRYQQDFYLNAWNGRRVKVTPSCETLGVTIKSTVDGTNPSMSNGFTGAFDFKGGEAPHPRAVVITRACKGDCVSPPVYTPIDIRREITGDTYVSVRLGSATGACSCAYWRHDVVCSPTCQDASGGCEYITVYLGNDYAGGFICMDPVADAPCAPNVGGGTLDALCMENLMVNILASPPVAVSEKKLSEVIFSEHIEFHAGYGTGYYGPEWDVAACPIGARFGGGFWRSYATGRQGCAIRYGTWDSYQFSDAPLADVYLIDGIAKVPNETGDYRSRTFPIDVTVQRLAAENFVGGSHSVTSFQTRCWQSIAASFFLEPIETKPGILEHVMLTQSVVNF